MNFVFKGGANVIVGVASILTAKMASEEPLNHQQKF